MANKERPRTKAALEELFKEWRQDYDAAKVRDEKGEAVVQTPQPEVTKQREIER